MYCIRCSTKLEAQDQEGRLRPTCPACGYVEYQQLKVGAGVLVEQAGALLLTRRGPGAGTFAGAWNLPAGYCEADESPAAAAAREADEETGLQVRVNRLVDVYYFDDDPRGNGLLIVYEAELLAGTAEHQLGPLHPGTPEHQLGPSKPGDPEVSAAAFFPPDQLPEPLAGGGHDRAIQAWCRRALDRWQPGEPPRYCPHCTHPLEEQLAFGRIRPACKKCGFVHFRDPKVGVSVLVERGGKVLLVKRAIEPGLGLWCLPAGFVDWDEPPEAAVVRECREETGLVVTGIELLDTVHYTQDFRGPGVNLIYRAQPSGGIQRPGDDAADVRWFSPDELPPREEIAFRSHYVALHHWREH